MLDRIRRAIRLARRVPSMPVTVPKWEPSDARNLRVFLASESGVKLGVYLRHLIVSDAMAAIHADGDRLAWRAGHAAGIKTTTETLDQLASWTDEKTAAKDDRPDDNLTWLHGNEHDTGRNA